MKLTTQHFYRGAVNLWVEDPITEAVLTELWQDKDINTIITSGKEGVRHMLRTRPPEYRTRVFGLVDRDFDEGDPSNWLEPDDGLFRLPAHEIENLLLDFEILAALSKPRATPSRIQDLALRHAHTLLPWSACKALLRQAQNELGQGFPTDPPQDPTKLGDPHKYVNELNWWGDHDTGWSRWSRAEWRNERLSLALDEMKAHLESASWMQRFPGKEILRHLRSHVAGLDATPVRPLDPTSAERDLDLAKRIARMMREHERAPTEIAALRRELRSRAGL